jgi:glycosyltransferase involved in cell wall biosynthesis
MGRNSIASWGSGCGIMKILIVSNLYPPHYVGGYELRCSQIAAFLAREGHDVRVLTSSFRLPDTDAGIGDVVDGVRVERSLHHHELSPPLSRPTLLTGARRQLQDIRRFQQQLDEFAPDLVNWWSLGGLTKALLPLPAGRGIPDVHCVDDVWMLRELGPGGEQESPPWFQFWRGSFGIPRAGLILRSALSYWEAKLRREGVPTRWVPLQPRHVCFISEFRQLEYRQAGFTFPSSEVIYGGVSPRRFLVEREPLQPGTTLRLLYVGYVEENRGLHTIVEALGLLPPDLRARVELSIAHSGPPKFGRYVERIRRDIDRLRLSESVHFLGKLPHEEMPRVYREHHMVISASTLPEGLPMSMLEGLCAGCAVLTTGSGGAAEIADLADLPIFPREHPLALSRLLARFVKDPALVTRIGQRGQEVVLREFGFERMLERTLDALRRACEDRPLPEPPS